MTRPDSSAYELTDAEKRDLIKLINEGKPLPDKYRVVLFQDKREVELVWNGKTREVTTAVLPFQTLEHIDEPREEIGEREAAGAWRSSAGQSDLTEDFNGRFAWIIDPDGNKIELWEPKAGY